MAEHQPSPPSPLALSRAGLRDTVQLRWQAFHPLPALYCTPAVVILLAAGVVTGHTTEAMVAVIGAYSVGFGAFQHPLSGSRIAPMLLAAAGMAFSTAVGSVASQVAGLEALFIGLSAYTLGVGTELGTSIWWVMLQWSIAFVIATAYPAGPGAAMGRAALILAGGFVQIGCVGVLRWLAPKGFPALSPLNAVEAPDTLREWRERLARSLSWHAPETNHAIALGITAGGAQLLARVTGLPNGYWVAMTVLLVLRRGTGQTITLGILRIVGTLIGAGLITLLLAVLRPSEISLMVLIAAAAWACYAVQWVNYGVFSLFVTAYVALFFAFAGLPELPVAGHRVVATLIGGGMGLTALVLLRLLRRPE